LAPQNTVCKIWSYLIVSEWKEYKLSDICPFITDGKHGDCKDEINSGYYFISAKDVRDGKIVYNNSRQITNADFQETHRRTNLSAGDIVITNSGTIGRMAIAKDIPETRRTTFQKSVAIVKPNHQLVSTEFLYYRLLSKFDLLVGLAGGTTQQNLLLGDLRDFDITIPGIAKQNAIASILISLDNKIDLLHRQNKTLEQLAETLFRQWFFEEVDENWAIGKFGDIVELNYGKGLKEEIRTGIGFPVIGSNGIVGYHRDYLVEGPGIVIGRKGTLGKVIYLFDNFYPIDTTYFVKSKINSVGLFYEYFLLKTLGFDEMNSDSAVPGLNRDIALSAEIRISSPEKIKEFNCQCSILFNKLNYNNNQIRTLTQLREALLPKLMSGEVRVK